MRKSLVCLAIVFVISFTCVGYSQETLTSQPDLPAARNVIEKYIEALGGELQLTSLNSFRFKARIIDDNDLWWKSEEYVQAGSNWMAHFRGPAFDFQSGVHDYRVWHHNLNNDKAWWHNSSWSIEGLNRAFDKPLGWLGQLQAIEVAGKEAIDGRDAWRLEFIIGRYFSEQSQGKTIRWFDTETGLMVKRETPFSDSRYLITQRFFDYRDVGGARFPFRVDNSLAGKDKQWTTEVVEFESLEESGKPVSWRPDSLKPIEDGLVARGIVVDSENGSPIVGASVHIYLKVRRKSYNHSTVTNSKGEFRFYQPGFKNMAVEYASITATPAFTDPWIKTESVRIDADGLATPLRIEVEKGYLIRGQVLDEETGQGVQVALQSRMDSASTDKQGNYFVKVAAGNHKFRVTAQELDRFELLIDDESHNPVNGLVVKEVSSNTATDASISLDLLKLESNPHWDLPVHFEDGTPAGNYEVVGHNRLFTNHVRSRVLEGVDVEQGAARVYKPVPFFEAARGFDRRVPHVEMNSEQPREILIYQSERNVGAAVSLHTDEISAANAGKILEPVELLPCASISGKFTGPGLFDVTQVNLAVKYEDASASYSKLDAEGNFKLDRIIPNHPFSIELNAIVTFNRQNHMVGRRYQFEELTPGAELDLGEIDLLNATSVRLVLKDESSGTPVSGATIKMSAQNSSGDFRNSMIESEVAPGVYRTVLGGRMMMSSHRQEQNISFEVKDPTGGYLSKSESSVAITGKGFSPITLEIPLKKDE